MKVELEKGVWLAPWEGDHGQTFIENDAREFLDLGDALIAIREARKFRPFKNAVVTDDIFPDLSDDKSVRIETALREEEQPKPLSPNPLAAENERLKKALKTLKNERAKFQPSRIKDMSDEDRLTLELAAVRAFCGKTLREGE